MQVLNFLGLSPNKQPDSTPAGDKDKKKEAAEVTTLHQLALTLEKTINEIKLKFPGDPFYSLLKAAEAKQTVEELQLIIKGCKNKNKLLNTTDLTPVIQFLQNRWTRIQGTDLTYFCAPLYPLNQLCVGLAKIISPYTQTKHPYQLVIPGLQEASIGDFKLTSVILDSTGHQFIGISDCLETTLKESADDGLYYRFKVDNYGAPVAADAKLYRLDETEQQLLLQHSKPVSDYYQAIGHYKKSKKDAAAQQILAAAKTKYEQSFGQSELLISYGESGRQKLANHLIDHCLPSVANSIKNIDDLLMISAIYPRKLATIITQLSAEVFKTISFTQLLTLLSKLPAQNWTHLTSKVDKELIKKFKLRNLTEAFDLLGADNFHKFLAFIPVEVLQKRIDSYGLLAECCQSFKDVPVAKIAAVKSLLEKLGADYLRRVIVPKADGLNYILQKAYEEKDAKSSVNNQLCCEFLKLLLNEEYQLGVEKQTGRDVAARIIAIRFEIMPAPLYIDFLKFLLEAKLGARQTIYVDSLIATNQNLKVVLTSSLTIQEKSGLLNLLDIGKLTHLTTLEELKDILLLIDVSKFPQILKKFPIPQAQAFSILETLPKGSQAVFMDNCPVVKQEVLAKLKQQLLSSDTRTRQSRSSTETSGSESSETKDSKQESEILVESKGSTEDALEDRSRASSKSSTSVVEVPLASSLSQTDPEDMKKRTSFSSSVSFKKPRENNLKDVDASILKACIADSKNLHAFLRDISALDDLVFAHLIRLVSIEYIQSINPTVSELIALLKLFKEADREAVLDQFDEDYVNNLLRNITAVHAIELFNLLPIEKRYEIWKKLPEMETLKREVANKLYTSTEQCVLLLTSVPSAERTEFSSYLPVNQILANIPLPVSNLDSKHGTDDLDQKESKGSYQQQFSDFLDEHLFLKDLVTNGETFDIFMGRIADELKSATRKEQAAIEFCVKLGDIKLQAIVNSVDCLLRVLGLITGLQSTERLMALLNQQALVAIIMQNLDSFSGFFTRINPQRVAFFYDRFAINSETFNAIINQIPEQDRLHYLISLPRELLIKHCNDFRNLARCLSLLTLGDQQAFLHHLGDEALKASFDKLLAPAPAPKEKNDFIQFLNFVDGELKHNPANMTYLYSLIESIQKEGLKLLPHVIINYGLDEARNKITEKYQAHPELCRVLLLAVVNAYHRQRSLNHAEYTGGGAFWGGSNRTDKLAAAANLSGFMKSNLLRPTVIKKAESKTEAKEQQTEDKSVVDIDLNQNHQKELNSGQLGRIFNSFKQSADLTERELRRRLALADNPVKLLEIIQDYKIYRASRLEEYFHTAWLSRLFGGHSRFQKLAAVDLMIQCAKGEISVDQLNFNLNSAQIKGAVHEGKLALIYEKLIQLVSSSNLVDNSHSLLT